MPREGRGVPPTHIGVRSGGPLIHLTLLEAALSRRHGRHICFAAHPSLGFHMLRLQKSHHHAQLLHCTAHHPLLLRGPILCNAPHALCLFLALCLPLPAYVLRSTVAHSHIALLPICPVHKLIEPELWHPRTCTDHTLHVGGPGALREAQQDLHRGVHLQASVGVHDGCRQWGTEVDETCLHHVRGGGDHHTAGVVALPRGGGYHHDGGGGSDSRGSGGSGSSGVDRGGGGVAMRSAVVDPSNRSADLDRHPAPQVIHDHRIAALEAILALVVLPRLRPARHLLKTQLGRVRAEGVGETRRCHAPHVFREVPLLEQV
mmetsp:Transcript_31414/g.69974  ORF Transcript_31414/g.69974 Transcript_31414/m.69974 type:complete len:317 (+) Transcript_31414:364-1314(+)